MQTTMPKTTNSLHTIATMLQYMARLDALWAPLKSPLASRLRTYKTIVSLLEITLN